MKAAVTIWNGRIAPVFDVAGRALLVDLDGHAVLSETEVALPAAEAMEKVAFLADQQTEVLVCGAMSRAARCAAEAYGLKVHAFLSGDIDDVLQALLADKLEETAFVMPGCGRRRGPCAERGRGRKEGVNGEWGCRV